MKNMQKVKAVMILIFLIACIIWTSRVTPLNTQPVYHTEMKFYGHRGYKGEYPENTIVAFEKAIDAGFDGIVFDIFETKSGDIMVFHDTTTDRMCEISDSIYNVSLENRDQYPIVKGKNIDRYGTLRIPTFEETAAVMKEKKGEMYIHLKEMDNFTDKAISHMSEILHKYDLADSSVFFCSKVDSVKRVEEKGLNTAINMSPKSRKTALEHAEECIENDIRTLIIFHPESVTQEAVDKCHENNIRVGVYWVKDSEEVTLLRSMGIDFIFSNHALFQ